VETGEPGKVRDFVEDCIGVGAQSTLWGHDIFARKKCFKN